MLQESVRNAYAKSYLKISHSEDDPKCSNLFGLTEDKLVHKESKKRKVQQVFVYCYVLWMSEWCKVVRVLKCHAEDQWFEANPWAINRIYINKIPQNFGAKNVSLRCPLYMRPL